MIGQNLHVGKERTHRFPIFLVAFLKPLNVIVADFTGKQDICALDQVGDVHDKIALVGVGVDVLYVVHVELQYDQRDDKYK